MNKFIKKLIFTYRISKLGNGLLQKINLFYRAVNIQKNIYKKGKNSPFKSNIRNNGKCLNIYFRGTLDELHALTEIFIECCYDPQNIPVKTSLDLGANIGLASLWIWSEFDNPIIHAYEADPLVYEYLKKNLDQIPSAIAKNIAITDHTGSIEFYSAERSFSSSIYPSLKSKVVKVQTQTLDQAILDIGNHVDLVKMDIEGAEFSVLEKTNNLAKINVIIGEVHPEKAKNDIRNIILSISKTHKLDSDISSGKSLFKASLKINTII